MNQSSSYQNTSVYTDGDYDRIGTMKKAADVVHAYFTWVLEDHRRTMVDVEHKKRIEQLILDTGAVFGADDSKEPLIRYFIANVIQACQEMETASLDSEAWLPFTKSAITEMYDPPLLAQACLPLSVHNQLMYAGRFLTECTETHPLLEEIHMGHIVGADLSLVQTVDWKLLLEGADIENDGSFICVGKALTQSTSVNELLDWLDNTK